MSDILHLYVHHLRCVIHLLHFLHKLLCFIVGVIIVSLFLASREIFLELGHLLLVFDKFVPHAWPLVDEV